MLRIVLGFAGLKSIWTEGGVFGREVMVVRQWGCLYEKGLVNCGSGFLNEEGPVCCEGISGTGVSGEKVGASGGGNG